jgi:predicted CopG family antitoxin
MVKTITIRDDVYEKLRVLKGDESLSDLIERMIGGGRGKGIDVLKKIRETIDLSSEEKEAVLKEIYNKRGEKRDFDDCLRYWCLDRDLR